MMQQRSNCPVCGRTLGLTQRNAAIRAARQAGATFAALARRYGVSKQRIFEICQEKGK